jgi:HEAT repeats
MRRKLFAAALAAAFFAAPLRTPEARAQQQPTPAPAPRAEEKSEKSGKSITVVPGVSVPVVPGVSIPILPGISIPVVPEISVNVVPDIYIEMPDIDIQVPPQPPLPPLPADAPEVWGPGLFDGTVFVGGDDFWVGEDSIEPVETTQSFQLSPGARVELTDINGPVVIDTAEGTTAELKIKLYSTSKNPRRLSVSQAGGGLRIAGPTKAERDRLDGFGPSRNHVRLTLPRRTNLSLTNISDSVRVGELDGSVSLTNIAGRVGIAQATGSAELSNVAGAVTLTLARLAGRGVSVSKVAGRVSLRFIEEVNAELQTSGVRGKVYVELPNVAVQGEMTRTDFRARVGAGGAPIRIDDVAGTVRLSPGRTVTEMLTIMKASERQPARSQVVTDLALHVSNPQVRQALVERLNSDPGGTVQATAARELVPYVREPEVREAFLRALQNGLSDATRATVARALGREFGGDKAVRDALLRALAAEKKDSVRQSLVAAVAKHTDDPAVVRALADIVRSTEARDSLRQRAASALAKRTANAEVYDLLLNAARNDRNRTVRVHALDGLARRIRERPELRELFVGYLDHESISLQYHALRGLVELNDASLRQRLVEKAREIVLLNGRRYWNDRMVLDTILLVRRIDPQEADRLLEQLGAERTRTF